MRALLIIVALAAANPARAYTAHDRAACEADARKLCSAGALLSAAFGNPQGVIACFRAHQHELSAACRAAVAAYHR